MTDQFQPYCLPALIGSLPIDDHEAAIRLVLKYTPEVPLWVQLPAYREEGMIAQFFPGMPGLKSGEDTAFIDTASGNFEEALVAFYEEYLAVVEGAMDISDSRFVLKEDTARGFFVFMEHLKALSTPPVAVKGQITGPITFGTGLSDQNKRAIFYDANVREAAVKLLALKAGWQVKQLAPFGCPVIIFIDEPALAGFGSSELISISRDEISGCLEEVIEAVHAQGGLAGIHVCANTDWSLILESSVDIVNFDAYSFFDRFILYPEHIRDFMDAGRIIAWGIVPTLKADDIERETAAALARQWEASARQVAALGIDMARIHAQSLITPSCGTGSLSLEHATRVLQLTREVADTVRGK